MSVSIVDEKRALALARQHRVNLKAIELRWWQYGLQTELDAINVLLATRAMTLSGGTKDAVDAAALYAIEKLKRYPDWYKRLKRCEDAAIKYWRRMDEDAEAEADDAAVS